MESDKQWEDISREEKQFEAQEYRSAQRSANREQAIMSMAAPILEQHKIESSFNYRYAFLLGYQTAIKDVKGLLP